MKYYVYILYSQSFNLYYKGMTSSPKQRLFEHNNGLSRFTKDKGPWEMVYLEEMSNKKEALIRERKLKKYNHGYLTKLIQQPQNQIEH